MRCGLVLGAAGVALFIALQVANARQAAPSADGRALFQARCAMCHGASGMGTLLLARRMPSAQAPLEVRADLTRDYVIQAARSGIGNMPRVQRGEVSDGDLAQIAAYLARGEQP